MSEIPCYSVNKWSMQKSLRRDNTGPAFYLFDLLTLYAIVIILPLRRTLLKIRSTVSRSVTSLKVQTHNVLLTWDRWRNSYKDTMLKKHPSPILSMLSRSATPFCPSRPRVPLKRRLTSSHCRRCISSLWSMEPHSLNLTSALISLAPQGTWPRLTILVAAG